MQAKDLAALVLLAALWGFSFVFMRIAAPVVGPVLLANVRVVIAGAVLLIYAVAVGRVPTLRARWRSFLFLGAVNAALPFTLISTAELHLTASLATILNATTPLFGALVSVFWLRERLTPARFAGLLLGFAGVAVLMGWSPLPLTLRTVLSAGASLAAAFCYALGTVYAKRAFAGQSALTLAIGQQLGAGLLLIPFTVPTVLLAPPVMPPAPATIASVAGLALLSTALAYLLFFRLVERVGPTMTLMVSFLVPIFGVLWGRLLLAEPIGPGMFLGLAIILSSVLLVAGMRPRSPALALASQPTAMREPHDGGERR